MISVRLRLLDLPLERDEGEYAYAGQLLLEGVPPYVLAYSMKWPGPCAAYAVIMAALGQTAAAIHGGLLLVSLATALLVFLLARRICGELGGAVAAGTCALLSASPPTLGLAAHAEHFVMLPALGGLLLLQDVGPATRAARLFHAGLLLGAAVLMKQSAAALAVFAALWLVRSGLATRLGWLALGGTVPLLLTGMLLWAAGVFGRFWYWTVDYARAYGAVLTGTRSLELLWETVGALFRAAPGLWGLALAGLVLCCFMPGPRRPREFVLSFTLFAGLAVCTGWYFRGHYFLMLVPAAALLAGVAVDALSKRLGLVAALLFGLAAAHSLWEARAIFFQLSPPRACRAIYGENPFPESVELGKFIAERCPPEERIAVLGSEPQIYFYSRRRSATGYIYTYPLMEPQPFAVAMQEEMIREIERGEPRYVVVVSVPTSWVERPDSHRRIFEWLDGYRRRLRLVALAEIVSPDETRYDWSVDGSAVTPRGGLWLALFENPRATAL